jgi:hypothetical protein
MGTPVATQRCTLTIVAQWDICQSLPASVGEDWQMSH